MAVNTSARPHRLRNRSVVRTIRRYPRSVQHAVTTQPPLAGGPRERVRQPDRPRIVAVVPLFYLAVRSILEAREPRRIQHELAILMHSSKAVARNVHRHQHQLLSKRSAVSSTIAVIVRLQLPVGANAPTARHRTEEITGSPWDGSPLEPSGRAWLPWAVKRSAPRGVQREDVGDAPCDCADEAGPHELSRRSCVRAAQRRRRETGDSP